jgi:hypothetical protein
MQYKKDFMNQTIHYLTQLKKITIMLRNISNEQCLEKGQAKRERLKEMLSSVTDFSKYYKFPSLYLVSDAGMGKSYTVNEYLKNSGVPFYSVTGSTSMFALGVKLACINYNNPNMDNVIVAVDDCDDLVGTSNSCNTLKQMLDGKREFNYERSLLSQMNGFKEDQLAAIEHFSEDGRMGFSVPVHNIRFIFSSNIELPDDEKVKKAKTRGTSRSTILTHRNAIRNRVENGNFILNDQEHFGWLLDVVQNTNCLTEFSLSDSSKNQIMGFMKLNWESLTERSIRSVEKLAQIMISYPDRFENIWMMDYIKPY